MGRLVDNRFSKIQGALLNTSTYNQTYKDYMLNTLQDKINSEFEYAFDVINIKTVDRENGLQTDVRVRVTKASKTKNIALNCNEDDVRQIIFQDMNYPVSLGDMFYFASYYWIVIDTDNINSPTASTIVRKCNNLLKFKYGNIDFSQSCVIQEIGKNNMRVETETEILTPDSNFLGVVPYNNNTRKIPLNARFIFGDFTYRVSGIDSISMIGLIKLKLQLDTNRPTDNFTTGYADQTGLVADNYSILITNGNSSITMGNTLQVNAQLLNNSNIVSNPQLLYSSSDETIATVSNTGLITSVGVGSCSITVSYANDATVKSSINLVVEAVPVVDNYSIAFNSGSSTSIILNSQATYNVTIMNNGNIDTSGKTVNFALSDLSSNPTNYATILSFTGTSCVIKANNSNLKGYVRLRAILSSDSSIYTDFNVQIKAVF